MKITSQLLGLLLLVGAASQLGAQPTPADTAATEALRRGAAFQ